MRAVIDTNVIVSALIAPSGNEALVLLATRKGLITPCLSEEICDEYSGVLARPKFGVPPDEIAAILALLSPKGWPSRQYDPINVSSSVNQPPWALCTFAKSQF